MTNFRIPRSLCAVIGSTIPGSHKDLEALFLSAGVPGPPPDLAHANKWKTWLFEAGRNPDVDSLEVLGNILEEFMDMPPSDDELIDVFTEWAKNRERIEEELEKCGLRYFQGGRVLPNGAAPSETFSHSVPSASAQTPKSVEDLLLVVLRNLRRAMYPLTHRRKGAQTLSFETEWDVQDMLHSLLRPWVLDIRPEEFTPSYAGQSTRMDFLLPNYSIVIELKFVRDRSHGKKIGQELIIDREHYRHHPKCEVLWCVIYDPNHYLENAEGLKNDLEGEHQAADGKVTVKVLVI